MLAATAWQMTRSHRPHVLCDRSSRCESRRRKSSASCTAGSVGPCHGKGRSLLAELVLVPTLAPAE